MSLLYEGNDAFVTKGKWMKIFSAVVGLAIMLSVPTGARAQEPGDVIKDEQPVGESGFELPYRESYDSIAGTAEYKVNGGSITLDDLTSRIVINSARGTTTLSLDDAALALANNDVQLATQYRMEMSQSLRGSEGILLQIQDLNGNRVFDENVNLERQRCQFDVICSDVVYINRFGNDYFSQYFDRTSQPPAPTSTERAIACAKTEDWELDFGIEMAEIILSCGIAETPPTFALCALMIGKTAKNQKDRAKADKICRDPRPNR